MRKKSVHIPKGMTRDLAASKFSEEYYYDALNIRLIPSDNNTLLSITNVKSSKKIRLTYLDKDGNDVTYTKTWHYIGHVVLNQYITVFASLSASLSADSLTADFIYRIDTSDNTTHLLAQGDFNFSTSHPIEGLGIYEKESVQKVYWVDGLNQPRVINIASGSLITDSTRLDFVRTLDFSAKVSVRRNETTVGYITAGTIQYVFTYFNVYGQESNIFYHSPLNYISYTGRGASPEDTKVSSSFTITISNPDTSFEYIRIYSIHRGSTNATPECRRVVDLPIGSDTQISYVDDGTNGAAIDPTMLLYIGGREIVPYTMEQKDNTLFFGNYTEKGSVLSDTLKNGLRNTDDDFIRFSADKEVTINGSNPTSSYYSYKHQLSKDSSQITTYKYGETYRFGVQLQKPTGEWSEPIFIKDAENTAYPTTKENEEAAENLSSSSVKLVQASCTLPEEWAAKALEEGYVRARPIVVFPSLMDRTVICQGVLNPTVFNVGDRATNSPFAQASWFFRPNYKEYTTDTGTNFPTFTSVLITATTIIPDNVPQKGTDVYLLRKDTPEDSNSPLTIDDEIDSYKYYGLIQLSWNNDADRLYTILTYGNANFYGATLGFYYLATRYTEIVNGIPTYRYTLIARLTNEAEAIQDENSKYRRLDMWNQEISEGLSSEENGLLKWNSDYAWKESSYTISHEMSYRAGSVYSKAWTVDSPNEISVPGTLSQFVHYEHLPFADKRNAEIQCNYYKETENSKITIDTRSGGSNTEAAYINKFSDLYFVDQSIVTLNSPEIDFDTSMQHIEDSTLKLRIVGYIPITATIGDYDITVSTPQLNYYGTATVAKGLWHEFVGMESAPGCFGLNTLPAWFDDMYGYTYGSNKNNGLKTWGYAVYPWHRSGSMNNQPSATLVDGTSTKSEDQANILIKGQAAGYRSAMLKRKVLSNLRYSANTVFGTQWTPSNPVAMTLFNSNEQINTRLTGQASYRNKTINYYGNVDKVLTSGRKYEVTLPDTSTEKMTGYPIFATDDFNGTDDNALYHSYLAKGPLSIIGSSVTAITDDIAKYSQYRYGYDPVAIRYKSNPHAVICLQGKGSNIETLPWLGGTDTSAIPATTTLKSFWAGNISTMQNEIGSYAELEYGYLWLGEIYNDMHSVDANGNLVSDDSPEAVASTRFGGTTASAVEGNTWLPAGEAISLSADSDNILTWTEGDAYYQRYDCLKTYPFTNEDPNSVVDICSFMVETRVNIEGRYDRNRGQMNNLNMSPLNFNLLNPGYTQQNNFFSYRMLDHDLFTSDSYPNYITWSKTKTPGEETDTWTNITLANVLDLDGDKGSVKALKRFNNTLFCFQDRGISQILYNEQMQMSTTDGVPIEIANSGKVQGKRYITETVGCQNKWSIATTPFGLYFMDSYNKTINRLSQGIEDLTNIHGFNSWAEKNIETGIWDTDRETEGAYRAFYDGNNKDVFFTGSHSENDCLVFSEAMNEFTSFYSWSRAMDMFNVNDGFYTFSDSTLLELHKNYAGEDFCRFLGASYPFYVTYIDAQDPLNDKIYTNLEMRGTVKEDGYPTGDTYTSHLPFDMLDVWNEYQHGRALLENNKGILAMQHHLPDNTASLLRKFRIWRCDIPRDNAPLETDYEFGNISRISRKPLDRIRNPWVYIRLYKGDEYSDREVQIHDMTVDYFI